MRIIRINRRASVVLIGTSRTSVHVSDHVNYRLFFFRFCQQLVKLKSTYFDGILSHVHEVNAIFSIAVINICLFLCTGIFIYFYCCYLLFLVGNFVNKLVSSLSGMNQLTD